MKARSLPTLITSLLIVALSVLGLSAPAQAAASGSATPSAVIVPGQSNSSAITLAITGLTGTVNALTVYLNGMEFVTGQSQSATSVTTSTSSFTSCGSSAISLKSSSAVGAAQCVVYNDANGQDSFTLTGNGMNFGTTLWVEFAANTLLFDFGSYFFVQASGGTNDYSSFPLQVRLSNAVLPQTVTFDANGGNGIMAPQTSTGAATLTPNSFTWTGYVFDGWATTPSGGPVYQDTGLYSFSSNKILYAVWSPAPAGGSGNTGGSTGSFAPSGTASSISATIIMAASLGQLVAGSTVAIVASGLESNAAFEVVVRSTPQTLTSGNASSGSVNTSTSLPAGLETGWHTLTFASKAADGSLVQSTMYFKISNSGTLLAKSTEVPSELANTGFDGAPYLLVGNVLGVLGVAVLLLSARRRQV